MICQQNTRMSTAYTLDTRNEMQMNHNNNRLNMLALKKWKLPEEMVK